MAPRRGALFCIPSLSLQLDLMGYIMTNFFSLFVFHLKSVSIGLSSSFSGSISVLQRFFYGAPAINGWYRNFSNPDKQSQPIAVDLPPTENRDSFLSDLLTQKEQRKLDLNPRPWACLKCQWDMTLMIPWPPQPESK